MQILPPFKCSVAKYLLNLHFRHFVDEAVLRPDDLLSSSSETIYIWLRILAERGLNSINCSLEQGLLGKPGGFYRQPPKTRKQHTSSSETLNSLT